MDVCDKREKTWAQEHDKFLNMACYVVSLNVFLCSVIVQRFSGRPEITSLIHVTGQQL